MSDLPIAIPPGEAEIVPFEVTGSFDVMVFADKLLNVYVMDDPGLERYKRGARDGHISANAGVSNLILRSTILVPKWYLVIENPSGNEVTVAFRVNSVPWNPPSPTGTWWRTPGGR